MRTDTKGMCGVSMNLMACFDLALWDSLSPSEQYETIEREEEKGYQSGIAPDETVEERLERVRKAYNTQLTQ